MAGIGFSVLGAALMLLSLALAIVPFYTDCQSAGLHITLANGKEIPMKCHWAGIAEIGVAVPMFIAGAMMLTSRRKESLSNLSILGIALGVLAMAFPTVLIGVCAMPTGPCVTLMQPALLALGGLSILVSVAGLVMAQKMTEKG